MDAAQLAILENAKERFVIGDHYQFFASKDECLGVFQSPDDCKSFSLDGCVPALGGSCEP